MKKQLICTGLCILLIMALIPVGVSATGENADGNSIEFSDISSQDWFFDAVKYVTDKGIMTGVSVTAFAPQDTTTRSQIITVLYRLAGEPDVSGGNRFVDVPEKQYYSRAVDWACETGITSGCGKDCFAPNAPITREQFATFLYRFAGYLDLNLDHVRDLSVYKDCNLVSDYAVDAFCWATEKELILGTGEDILSPKENATRAQFATVMMRYCSYMER